MGRVLINVSPSHISIKFSGLKNITKIVRTVVGAPVVNVKRLANFIPDLDKCHLDLLYF